MNENGTAQINGAEINYEVSGEGQPIIFLHAGIADSRMWQKQVSFFSRHYQVITFDFRGFGKSPMPTGPYAYYRDLAGLMDTLGIEGAILVGCSLGGSVAIDFTLEYPDRVEALVLVGSAVDGYRMEDEKTRENWSEIETAFIEGDLDKVADLEIEHWIIGNGESEGRFKDADLELLRDMILTHYRYDPDQGEEEGPDEMSINRLGQIKIPTLTIVGDLDTSDMIKISDLLVRDIQGAKKVIIQGTAHLPCYEKPDEFNEIVHAFLKEAGL